MFDVFNVLQIVRHALNVLAIEIRMSLLAVVQMATMMTPFRLIARVAFQYKIECDP
jgi:hypothetical protein